MTSSEMTPADFAAITNGGGFGAEGGAWWIIILFLFAFAGGWGNGGGYGNNSGSSVKDQYVLSSDFATIQRQLSDGFGALESKGDAINNGLCSGFYETARIGDGINTNILTNSNAIQVANMQGFNALQAQLSQCCCDNKAAIADVKYNMAMNTNTLQNAVQTGFCQTNFNNQSNTRDIIDNQNANARAILDALNAQTIAAKDEKIAEQNQRINALQLAASQQAQNAYLIEQLSAKCPVPSYLTANPNGPLNYSVPYGCGCACGQ